MKRILFVIMAIFAPMVAFAQTAELPVGDFLMQMMDAIKAFGGLSQVGKIALGITIIISSMKVSLLNKLVWDKLGSYKAVVAPLLGLIAGLLNAGSQGKLPTFAEAMAYVAAGAGAIILHEMLDMIKAIPGVGPIWVGIIDFISGFLGKK